MTEKSLKINEDIYEEDLICQFKYSLKKIETNIKAGNIDLLKGIIENFVIVSMSLISKFEVLLNVKDKKAAIHQELKNFVINKYIKTISNQEKVLVKKNQEIEKMRKDFEKLVMKNEKIGDKKNEQISKTKEQTKKLTKEVKVEKYHRKNPLQENLSSLNVSYRKDTESKQEIKLNYSQDQSRMILDIEADKIYNDRHLNYQKKISQSPIHNQENAFEFKDKNIEKSLRPSPSKSSRAHSKETALKRELKNQNKVRNVNRFINANSVSLNKNVKINSSHQNLVNLQKSSKTINVAKLNRSVTPVDSSRIDTDSRTIQIRKNLIRNQKIGKGNKIFLNLSNDDLRQSVDDKKQNSDSNKQSANENKEKKTLNYSQKMLQKYYEMLDKFNKKLEEKDVLITNKHANKSPVERKIIYIKENEIKNKNRSAILKNNLQIS